LILQHIADAQIAIVIILQETHHSDAKNLIIPGFDLIADYPHEKHGIASFVRSGTLTNLINESLSTGKSETQWNTIEVNGIHIFNVYHPSSAQLDINNLLKPNGPTVIAGDFNCSHSTWGYTAEMIQMVNLSKCGLKQQAYNFFRIQKNRTPSSLPDGIHQLILTSVLHKQT